MKQSIPASKWSQEPMIRLRHTWQQGFSYLKIASPCEVHLHIASLPVAATSLSLLSVGCKRELCCNTTPHLYKAANHKCLTSAWFHTFLPHCLFFYSFWKKIHFVIWRIRALYDCNQSMCLKDTNLIYWMMMITLCLQLLHCYDSLSSRWGTRVSLYPIIIVLMNIIFC